MTAAERAYERVVDSAAGRADAREWLHVRTLAVFEHAAAIVAECDRQIARLAARSAK